MPFLKAISFIIVFLTALTQVHVYAVAPNSSKTTHTFQITIESDAESFILKGQSELVITPSSYSINMIEDNGRCVMHMLNFSTPPGPGTYDVENDDKVKTAMVCLLEKADVRERLASVKGTFTITDLNSTHLVGHFDMTLTGPISGKEFRAHGQVKSAIEPMSLQFGP